ncbi:conjugative relaxase domain-containing protein, TrwC/TraI family [Promicromonospora umidemergens]|uniref:MobF family relaxase n=1 Tax=Promicromonospora umidemergens TaxID=629679 RepID=A0ABP8XU03_9MICO|nr:MobF family relaxase [Promicromonospora umidemergens]MCP2285366.1 conjugative relaxase domain-containing protein, TrwC/TraI family [Promicromonospora umidemergens]
MTVTIAVMSAGDGYSYFMKSVAAGDGDRSMGTPLTRYYTETGTPPGRWMGAGVASLGSDELGRLLVGDLVTEEQMARLAGKGLDPIAGEQLGRAYPVYGKGNGGKPRRAVAGYDFTFSLPKSASVLWGVADAGVQEQIVAIHRAAVVKVFEFTERELAATRTGASVAGNATSEAGEGGAVAQVGVTGLIAMTFDHWDSRTNDPHLHTHVVVSNKVKTLLDGKWRSLDGRGLHAATVAMSELHEAIVMDDLTRALGVGWELRARARQGRNPGWSIKGVPDDLVAAFSQRSEQINPRADELIAQHVKKYGRRPGRSTIDKYRQRASKETRPDKTHHSLADLTTVWRHRTAEMLGHDPAKWVGDLVSGTPPRMLRAGDVPLDLIDHLAQTVVIAVSEKKPVWRRWNLYAEATRQTKALRFVTAEDRMAVLAAITDRAEDGSVRLTPSDLAATPAEFRREDGTSILRPKDSALYSSQAMLDAEARLMDRASARTAPTITLDTVDHAVTKDGPGERARAVSGEQAEAIARVAVSARQVDLLVGPAGTGKTTTMRALRAAWEQEHGAGSVVGLAPSAAAAAVLADDLGIGCENTAKWLYDHVQQGAAFSAGQLVIIDEATLAGTLTLDRITAHASEVGAKVLLVGDPAQLQAVEAGGAFALLTAARQTEDGTPELTEVHRFTHMWEKNASLALRHGYDEAIDAYLENGRVRDGDAQAMVEAAYAAWQDDLADGKDSVLVAGDNETVRAVNERARTERLRTGTTERGRSVRLADGLQASAGDVVITRRNDRRLRTRNGSWVRNGDRWALVGVRDDGSVVVRRPDAKYGNTIVLPAAYTAEHLDLGYAVTTYRAQGLTVDTSHLIAGPGMTRENLYVGMTRGRETNTAYVITDTPLEITPDDHEDHTPRSILAGIVRTVGAEKAATQVSKDETERWGSVAQLAAEYETLAEVAQRDRWTRLVHQCGLSAQDADQVITAPAFGALTAELRRAEADGHDVEQVLPRLVAQRGLDDADDPAAVLHHRLASATAHPVRYDGLTIQRPAPRRIAGLIPEAAGPMTDEYRLALEQRAMLIERRITDLVQRATRDHEPWLTGLGPEPADTGARHTWQTAARRIAAYRDRYGITSSAPLGNDPVSTDAQAVDAARVAAALRRATRPPTMHARRPGATQQARGIGM